MKMGRRCEGPNKKTTKYVVYRCALCNELVYVEMPEETLKQDDKDFCNKVLMNQQFAGNPYLHQAQMHVLHNCKDGSVGIATFAGIKKCQ